MSAQPRSLDAPSAHRARRTTATVGARLAALLLMVLALCFGGLNPAQAAGEASTDEVAATVNADGSMQVTSTLTFDDGAPEKLEQRLRTREEIVDNREYVHTITDVKVTVDGKDAGAEVNAERSHTVISAGTAGAKQVVISYKVGGAALQAGGGETLVDWNLLQGLSVPVQKLTAEVSIPGQFTDIQCTAGAPGTQQSCTMVQGAPHEGFKPTLEDGPRGPGEVVGIQLTFPSAVVASNEIVNEHWTVERAFSAKPLQLLIALGVLALGALGLFVMHRRSGADAATSGDPTTIAEFVPVGAGESEFKVTSNIRPGEVGTVADERVDPIDVTATILDLAVRGHLRITELEHRSAYAPADWSFTRLEGGRGELKAYETDLLDAIAPAGQEPVLVSQIGESISGAIPQVQEHLYDDMVSEGWYNRSPESTRRTWNTISLVFLVLAIVAAGLLAAFTTFGLVGLALIAIGLGLAFVAQQMPARTGKGAQLLSGLGVLRAQLIGQPTNQMPAGRELSELSEVLPYAIVLGGRQRWLQAIVDADDDDEADSTDLDWFHGPSDWHLKHLPDSLENFIVTLQGHLFNR